MGYLYYNGVNYNYNFVPIKYYVDQLKELKGQPSVLYLFTDSFG